MKILDGAKRPAAALLCAVLFATIACSQTQVASISPSSASRNHVPVIEHLSYPADTVANADVQLECNATDEDEDNLTYHWIASAGTIGGPGPEASWFPPPKMGTYTLAVVVSDGKGGEASKEFSIRVLTNADGTATPRIEVNLRLGDATPAVVDGRRARIWTTTEIVCIAETAAEGALTYTWSSNDGKITGKGVQDGKADKISWTAPGVQSDNIIDVKVVDAQGKQAVGQVRIHVFCCGN